MINDSRWPRGAAFLAMSHELLYIRVQVDSTPSTPRILEPWNPFKTSS
ncbi:MAG: hypothetical protein NTU69_10535 [Proteobacteria bacterium]|nr:hypothetical protein [Pseudomonadota bacterium]